MNSSKNFIVITSIFPPSEAIKKLANIDNWQLVVVGDKKTPRDWHFKNVVYISPDEQSDYSVANKLPWNHYSRKMIGYEYAIRHGADVIADTDDDNIPYDNWGVDLEFDFTGTTLSSEKFINIYKFFTDKFIWPRGYPLDRILETNKKTEASSSLKTSKVGIWQYLADDNPDVDAIFRLTDNSSVHFTRAEKIVLDRGSVSPLNSQNTFFKKESFPLLFLPSTVSFRFTDILRGLIAQPLLWSNGCVAGFGPATVFQVRNQHNFLHDFRDEVSVYLHSEEVVDIAIANIDTKVSLVKNLECVYKALIDKNIVLAQELEFLKNWLSIFK